MENYETNYGYQTLLATFKAHNAWLKQLVEAEAYLKSEGLEVDSNSTATLEKVTREVRELRAALALFTK